MPAVTQWVMRDHAVVELVDAEGVGRWPTELANTALEAAR